MQPDNKTANAINMAMAVNFDLRRIFIEFGPHIMFSLIKEKYKIKPVLNSDYPARLIASFPL